MSGFPNGNTRSGSLDEEISAQSGVARAGSDGAPTTRVATRSASQSESQSGTQPATPPDKQATTTLTELQDRITELQRQLRHAQTARDAALVRFHNLYDLAPIAYLGLAFDGTIRQANLKATTLLGIERVRLGAWNVRLERFVASECRAAFAGFVDGLARPAGDGLRRAACAVTLDSGDGHRHEVRIDAVGLAGEPECHVWITERVPGLVR